MNKILNELELQISIDEGNVEEIKRLAKAGVNLDLMTPEGNMLIRAAKKSHWNIVELLIDLGANVYTSNGLNKWELLHNAAKLSWMPVLQFYIHKKFDLDVTTASGETSLMIASEMNNKTVVEMLINAGADVNRRDRKRKTAFHYAAYKGQINIVQFLVDNKADVNAQDFRGYTALQLVLKKFCDVEMVGFLIKVGVDCNIEDNEGITAFNLLTEKGLLDAIRLGIEKGAYVKSGDYCKLSVEPLLKSNVLNRVNYCSQAIINKYHNKDLPDLYKVRVASEVLPPIEHFKIGNNSRAAIEIARSVNQDIQKRSYCHLMEVRPLVLSKMCVESFIAYVRAIEKSTIASKQTNPPVLKSALDRLLFKANSAKKIRKFF